MRCPGPGASSGGPGSLEGGAQGPRVELLGHSDFVGGPQRGLNCHMTPSPQCRLHGATCAVVDALRPACGPEDGAVWLAPGVGMNLF